MRPVNLLPDDLAKVRKPVNRPALAGVAGTSAVAMLLAAGYLSASSTVNDRQATLAGLQQELAAVPKPKTAPASNDVLASARSARINALSGILSHRVGWDRLLREISAVLPADVWLSTMNAKGPAEAAVAVDPLATAGVPTTDSPFRIEGHTYSYEGVARLLARMQTIPDLSSVRLENSELTELNGQTAVKFTISAQIRPTGATS